MTFFADVLADLLNDDIAPDAPTLLVAHNDAAGPTAHMAPLSDLPDSDADTLPMEAIVTLTGADQHDAVMSNQLKAHCCAHERADTVTDDDQRPPTVEAQCAQAESDPESDKPESEKTDSESPPKRRRFWRKKDVSPPRRNGDALLDLLEHAMDQPSEESPSSWSSFDSQATKNEDPSAPEPPEPQEPTHWSMDEMFQQHAKDLLDDCKNKWWYKGAIPYIRIGLHLDYEIALNHSIEFIRANVQSLMTTYKIGITCCPLHRFEGGTKHAYIHDSNEFSNMKILWVCVHSRKDKKDSSGRFETSLIEIFNSDVCEFCINRPGGGADCPARGSPNTVYVVW